VNTYLTVKECAEYLHRSQGALRNLILRRRIPYRKPQGRVLFIKEEIDKWVEFSEGVTLESLIEEEER
jgi:excisionase family DNA binding protein